MDGQIWQESGMRRNPALSGGSGLVWSKNCIKRRIYD